MQLRARKDHAFGPETEVTTTTEENGSIALTWLKSADSPNIISYQFRLRHHKETEWRPWRNFTPLNAESIEWSNEDIGSNTDRIFSYTDWTSRVRIYMATTALRYSLDYPLGTGIYHPDESHVTGNLDARSVEEVLSLPPHNQFLHMMVLFGFPGLILLILFYVLVLRSLMQSLRLIVPLQNTALNFLIIGVVGALAAYSFGNLFHTSGPFLGGWIHFFIIGLAFSVQRIAASYEVNQEPEQI